MMDASVIYYSSNTESQQFEEKIQRTILKNCGGLPIISVTHRPMNFGANYHVGNVGVSEMNMLRQILIGCKAASTEFVISAEADCLYPPDYFQFRPPRGDACYRNNNTYIIGYKRECYWKKPEGGTWAQVINRQFYIDRLEELLLDAPEWDANAKRFVKEKGMRLFDSYETFTTKNPCISLKTAHGMHRYSHSERVPIETLPFWGSAIAINQQYL